MKRAAALALAALISSSAAVRAQEAALPTLVQPGQTIAPGDYLRTTRVFQKWSLNCDVLLSTKTHFCAMEQSISAEGRPALKWSIAPSADKKAVMVISVLPQVAGANVTLKFGEMTLLVHADQCDGSVCKKVLPVNQTLYSAIREGVIFQFNVGDKQEVCKGDLDGFDQALAAVQTDPIGFASWTSQPAKKTQKKRQPGK